MAEFEKPHDWDRLPSFRKLQASGPGAPPVRRPAPTSHRGRWLVPMLFAGGMLAGAAAGLWGRVSGPLLEPGPVASVSPPQVAPASEPSPALAGSSGPPAGAFIDSASRGGGRSASESSATAVPRTAAAAAGTASRPRIIIHHRAGKNGKAPHALATFLAQSGTPAAGDREVPGETTVSRVRYFWPEDRPAAERLNARLAEFLRGRSARLRPPVLQDLTKFNPRPSHGTLEIWLEDAAG